MEDEEPQTKRNNFDITRATVNYSNLVPNFPSFLDLTMLVNRRELMLRYDMPSTCFSFYPKLSYIINNCARPIPWKF